MDSSRAERRVVAVKTPAVAATNPTRPSRLPDRVSSRTVPVPSCFSDFVLVPPHEEICLDGCDRRALVVALRMYSSTRAASN